MRLTKKYFKDKVNENAFSAINIIALIVEKYGKNPIGYRKRKSISVPRPEVWWNHYITDFHFYNNKLFAGIYWQGSDTDGNDAIQIIPGKLDYRIPSESYYDGYRTRTIHPDIRINSEELYDAIKAVVNSL